MKLDYLTSILLSSNNSLTWSQLFVYLCTPNGPIIFFKTPRYVVIALLICWFVHISTAVLHFKNLYRYNILHLYMYKHPLWLVPFDYFQTDWFVWITYDGRFTITHKDNLLAFSFSCLTSTRCCNENLNIDPPVRCRQFSFWLYCVAHVEKS